MEREAAHRAGRREANLRKVNERVVVAVEALEAAAPGDGGTSLLQLICECALDSCEEMIAVPAAFYDEVRERTDVFLVAPGHVLHEIEDGIEDGDGWIVVRKRGAAADGARDALEGTV
ncbi:MAG: hypothetical protein JWM25_858 [Thermoleophilia bacterium]|nr:hypothetical protein [Thermoleophilia bacterium]MCZ4496275.1 hypothetical protein [Thermoleophilia bacterium]